MSRVRQRIGEMETRKLTVLASAGRILVLAGRVLSALSVLREARGEEVGRGGTEAGGSGVEDKMAGVCGGVVPATSRASRGDASVVEANKVAPQRRRGLVHTLLEQEAAEDVKLGPAHARHGRPSATADGRDARQAGEGTGVQKSRRGEERWTRELGSDEGMRKGRF